MLKMKDAKSTHPTTYLHHEIHQELCSGPKVKPPQIMFLESIWKLRDYPLKDFVSPLSQITKVMTSKTSICNNACINSFKSLKLEKDPGPAAGTKAGAQERYLFALSRNNFLWSKEGQVVELHGQNQQINFQESNQLIPLKRGRTSRFTSLACHAIQAPKDPLRCCSQIWAWMLMRPNNLNRWLAGLSLLTAYFHESFKDNSDWYLQIWVLTKT